MNIEHLVSDALLGFCRQQIEPVWAHLNQPQPQRYANLWRGLADMGVTLASLPENKGGLALDVNDIYDIYHALGRSSPALGCALISHTTALALASEQLPDNALSASFSLLGSPLDVMPSNTFSITRHGKDWRVEGSTRSVLPAAEWRLFAARSSDGLRLCRVSTANPALKEEPQTAPHGLRLLPVGEVSMHNLQLDSSAVSSWPTNGYAANLADGMLGALLTGLVAELAERAQRYAVERRQGGKLLYQHDAVLNLLGPMTLAAWPLEAMTKATLATPRTGDASVSTLAVGIAQDAGLDAIQTLGGVGYMEDFRVERYLRDSQAIANLWVHSGARQRTAAGTQSLARLH